MTAPLIAADDADLDGWKAGDQATFLDMVCHEVRKYCGWHIAPSVSVTGKRCWFGADHKIMLGSRYVTSIQQVTVDDITLVADQDYFWDEPQGWIRRRPHFWPHNHWALVDFTHGYDEPPSDLKAIIFEVMATAMELPASNATTLQTMQYNITLNSSPNGDGGTAVMAGVSLSRSQKERLGQYRLYKFGGLVRP